MIPISEARLRSRDVHAKNEEIRKEEEAIDNVIRNESANGHFDAFVQLPSIMDVVIDRYRAVGYTLTPKYSTYPDPKTNSYVVLGYHIYWGEIGDPTPIVF